MQKDPKSANCSLLQAGPIFLCLDDGHGLVLTRDEGRMLRYFLLVSFLSYDVSSSAFDWYTVCLLFFMVAVLVVFLTNTGISYLIRGQKNSFPRTFLAALAVGE